MTWDEAASDRGGQASINQSVFNLRDGLDLCVDVAAAVTLMHGERQHPRGHQARICIRSRQQDEHKSHRFWIFCSPRKQLIRSANQTPLFDTMECSRDSCRPRPFILSS